ncbi:UNVERIFIED_CONTAM: hypothetical protein GTU68_048570 [Idotea baltica]|nr:hypothetical protein [Idotea baltica]
MKAIVCKEPGQLESIEIPIPKRREGETLLKIKSIGICGTDLHAYAGNQVYFTYPRILGHEISAEIAELDPDAPDELSIGQQVVVIPYLHCGTCHACKIGRTNCCSTLKVFGVHIDGCMQEFFSCPTDLLLPAAHLSSHEMAIVEPLCIGAHAVRRAKVSAGDCVVVSGCGPIGAGIVWSAKAAGAKVIALDLDQRRLSFCVKELGADHAITAGQDVEEVLKEYTNGRMAQVVFDATGIKKPMEKAIDYLSPGGTYVLVGLHRGDLSFSHPSIHGRELTIMCSRNATKGDFLHVIEQMKSPGFPSNQYITHAVPSPDIVDQFGTWRESSNHIMKVITDW